MEGAVLKNKYVVRRLVGSGGMAIVYRGYCVDTGREVAIKMLREEFLEDEQFLRRFRKESLIATRYSHENIVNSIDVGEENGRPYIVMEYVDGCTLKALIQKQGCLPAEQVVRIGMQIANALGYAHSHHLIHRDIKPQNILISADNGAKVADFGIAQAPLAMTVTMEGSQVMGSVHYISPEQARGGFTNEKTDLYSFGVVLYEMATGRVPFQGDTPVAVALMHMQEPPPAPRQINPAIPPALERIILKAMSKQQAQRYDSARQMMDDLAQVLNTVLDEQPQPPVQQAPTSTLPLIPSAANRLSEPDEEVPPPPPPPSPPTETEPQPGRKPPARLARRMTLSAILRLILLAVVVIGIFATMFMIMHSILQNTSGAPVEVPGMVGRSVDEARRMLIERQLFSVVQEEYDESEPMGNVIRQVPDEGAEMARGDTVVLYVSLGPEVVEVPELLNLPWDDAVERLRQVGLTVGAVFYRDSDQPEDTVLQQSPGASEMVAPDSTVDLTLSRQITVTDAMPSLLGMQVEDAQSTLEGWGLQYEVVSMIDSDYMFGRIAKQEPAPGDSLNPQTVIRLWTSTGQGTGYMEKATVRVSVEMNQTRVAIYLVDGGQEQTVYQEVLDKGVYDIPLNLWSGTLGEKVLRVECDGQEVVREPVTFDGGV